MHSLLKLILNDQRNPIPPLPTAAHNPSQLAFQGIESFSVSPFWIDITESHCQQTLEAITMLLQL